MKKGALILWILVIILIIGFILFYRGGLYRSGNNATSTGSVSLNTNGTNGTPVQLPDVPTVETSQDVSASNSTAIVSGRVRPNGALTSYWFEYGQSSALGTRTSTQNIGSGYTVISTPAYITGLKPNTLYYFRLNAKNSYGTVVGQTYTFSTNNNLPPQALAPDANTNPATQISRTGATLNGRLNPNGFDTQFWFEYGKNSNLGNVTEMKFAGNGTKSIPISLQVSGLDPLTVYYFRINAQNQFGTVNGLIQTFSTPGPAAPGVSTVETLSADTIATSSVVFHGNINPNGVTTLYWFEYGTTENFTSPVGITPTQNIATSTTKVSVAARVDGLDPNTVYYYRLVGKNQYGTVVANTISFKTK